MNSPPFDRSSRDPADASRQTIVLFKCSERRILQLSTVYQVAEIVSRIKVHIAAADKGPSVAVSSFFSLQILSTYVRPAKQVTNSTFIFVKNTDGIEASSKSIWIYIHTRTLDRNAEGFLISRFCSPPFAETEIKSRRT